MTYTEPGAIVSTIPTYMTITEVHAEGLMFHPLLPQDDDCHKLAPKLQSPSTWELALSDKPLRTYILHGISQSRLGLQKTCDHFGEAQQVIRKGKPRYCTKLMKGVTGALRNSRTYRLGVIKPAKQTEIDCRLIAVTWITHTAKLFLWGEPSSGGCWKWHTRRNAITGCNSIESSCQTCYGGTCSWEWVSCTAPHIEAPCEFIMYSDVSG